MSPGHVFYCGRMLDGDLRDFQEGIVMKKQAMIPNQIGRYKILALLGQGAMGTVYRAHDPDLAREVALKLVAAPERQLTETWHSRFRREVQAAGQLKHPHIVTVYDVNLEHDQPHVVMELLTGGTLKKHLQQKSLSWLEALILLKPLAQALAYAHQGGIVHRDVKPANVMFDGSPEPALKLVDFGLAHQPGGVDATHTGAGASLFGTPAYMSPEQAQQQAVDARTDIFALGIIIIEAITGQNPLRRGSVALTLADLVSGNPLDLSTLTGHVPLEALRLIERTVAKDRDQRYPSCDALLKDLAYILDDPTQLSGWLSDPTLATNLPTGQGPTIQTGDISLTTEEETVLRTMFSNCSRVSVWAEFGAGLSGGRVLKVRTKDLDGKDLPWSVVKIGPVGLIQQEVQAYHNWVENSLIQIARLGSWRSLPQDGIWGGLSYELTGSAIFDIESLGQFYRRADIDELEWLLKARLFRVMGDSWWLDNRVERSFLMRTDYDRLLPTNLLITPIDPPADSPIQLITPQQLPSRPLLAGEYVQLQGFIITEVEPARGRLTLNLPQPPLGQPQTTFRLRLEPVAIEQNQYQVGQLLEPISGQISQTRLDQLIDLADRALGSKVDLTEPQLSLPQISGLSNPLMAYEEILNSFRQVKLSTIHGDLNLENILIYQKSGELASIIDFATVRYGHALHDLLRLETEVVTKLIPEQLASADLGPETIHLLYQQLHQATVHAGAASRAQSPHPKLAKPFAVLSAIRMEMRKCLFNPDDTTEYYESLVLYLLGALKFKNLDEIPQAKTVTFLAAATVVTILRQETVEVQDGWPLPDCPYRGLEFFDVAHADFFFGREQLVSQLLAKLRPAPGYTNRFLAIIGPSGSGKSSLARAGVIAALQQDELQGSANWPVVICRPGNDPLRNLAVALNNAPGFGQDLSATRQMIDEFRENPKLLDLAVQMACPTDDPDWRLVLLVDQFEEIFTLCQDEAERRSFLENLLYAATVTDGKMVLLLTMRADFYGKCAAYPTLAKTVSNHQALVGPMTAVELRRAIEKPAHQTGCTFEPGLVTMLIYDVEDQSGGLPLLQYALMEMWTLQERRRLTRAAYESIGRVGGALEQRGEMVFATFNEPEQEICRRIFLRLTQPGEGTEDTKRQASLNELLPAGGDFSVIEHVIQRLAGDEARLITTKLNEEADGQQVIEVAHEALIRNWSRLQNWLEENREDRHIQRRLAQAAKEWVQHDLDDSYLYRGARLTAVEQWSQIHADHLNALEKTFLEISLDEREREAAEQEAFRQRELEQTQALAQSISQRLQEQVQATKRLRWLVAALTVVFFVAVGAAILALNRQQIAKQREVEAQAAQQVAEAETQARATAQAQAEQKQIEAETQARIASSRALASAAISSLATDPELSLLLALEAVSTTYSVDGGVTSEAEQTLHRALQTSRVRRTLAGHTDWVVNVTYSPDGTRLATAGLDNSAGVWTTESNQMILNVIHDNWIWDAAFSPDGNRLATASEDKTAKVWGIPSGSNTELDSDQARLTLTGHTQAVLSVAFRPDGLRLATASRDRTVKLWDAATGEELLTFEGHTGSVEKVVFSPDGARLATASRDKTARLWDAATGETLLTLTGHTDWVWSVAFNPEGTRLVTTSQDETVKIWMLSPGRCNKPYLAKIMRFGTQPLARMATVWAPPTPMAQPPYGMLPPAGPY